MSQTIDENILRKSYEKFWLKTKIWIRQFLLKMSQLLPLPIRNQRLKVRIGPQFHDQLPKKAGLV